MGKISRPETVNVARNIGRHDAMKKRFVLYVSYDIGSYNTSQKHDSCIEGKERKEYGRTLLRSIGEDNVLNTVNSNVLQSADANARRSIIHRFRGVLFQRCFRTIKVNFTATERGPYGVVF